MGRRTALGLVVALVLVIGGAGVTLAWNEGSGSSAAGTASEGKIAFADSPAFSRSLELASAYADHFDLDVIDADGSNRERLVACPRYCLIPAYAWSPDGRRLAFVRAATGGRGSGPGISVFVVAADGKGERRLLGCRPVNPGSCDGLFTSRLAWSPDGSRLVVPRGDSLFVVDVDRGGHRRVTSCGRKYCFDTHPAWAPDGSTIAFTREWRTGLSILGSVYSVRPDGSGLARLTNLSGRVGGPAWSPDARRIAFDESGGGWKPSQARLYVMGADGSGLKLLASGPTATGPRAPAWSPDGTRIMFLRTPGTNNSFFAEVWAGTGRRDRPNTRLSVRLLRGNLGEPDLVAGRGVDRLWSAVRRPHRVRALRHEGRRERLAQAGGCPDETFVAADALSLESDLDERHLVRTGVGGDEPE